MNRQLVFDLPVREALGLEDFFVSPSNSLALAALEGWQNWPSGKLALIGPEGAGKTHLAHVWASDTGAQIISAQSLIHAEIPALSAKRYVVVEDLQKLAGRQSEEALFHLHNLVLAEGGRLLFTATSAPARWLLSLPDLRSRMEGTSVARIDAPDDKLLAAMLAKQFNDRQSVVPNTLIPYIVPRMERSARDARRIVEALDAQAVAERRPISVQMAGKLLDNLASDAE
ncbi:DnaA regulatory inactivator Hda [Aquimixticola soesokkakensis]|uniref:DnaA regulatory inactivator Hda n=1 Tax=Aquimixticola soesokkakensis TaxID=1519096 RepID=A0A1Y5T111_9RHOB|nr:DnaA/Hda family protein [Aquimixticola soesokkakensis]SLN49594.1 DnaA regulatory inactivator Hda [Aquimixticola soesokkakensis]